MNAQYHSSAVTNMDMEDSKIAYSQFFADGSKLRCSDQNIKQEHQSNLKAITKEKENLQQNLRIAQREKKDVEAIHAQLQQSYDYISLQTQYDIVLKSRKELQTNYDSVNKERDNLQNKFNNATRSREQLQISYNDLVKKVEGWQDRYNLSVSEKSKLATSHQNLTTEIDILQAAYDILKKAENDLQASYASLVKEKDDLENRFHNVTTENNLLKGKNDNLTAERDKLLEEIVMFNGTFQFCPTNYISVIEKKCLSGWKKFKISCYYTATVKKNWAQSRQFCQNKGADLAIIKTEEEMTFINGLYSSDKEVWIGLTDEGVEGQWKWVDGTPLPKTFWGKGQPNSYSGRNQDCVEFCHKARGIGD
ncbi:uncharacterized protein KZ484_024450 [Pholidichthys leucotaenia]